MLSENEIRQYQQALAQRIVQLANETRATYEWSQRALDGSTPITAADGTKLTPQQVADLQAAFTPIGLVSQVLRGGNANPVNVLYQLLGYVLPRQPW